MTRALSVLLDVSPLTRQVEHRTGLARVAGALQAALSDRPEIALQTCAWGSLSASRNLRQLSAEQPGLGAIGSSPGYAERWYERWLGDERELSPGPRWLRHRIGQAINLTRNPLRGIAPTTFDVIHSTYARFPRIVRGARVPTVITVHDLIPLTLPVAMVGKAQRAITRRIINSIRPVDHVACVSEATRADFLEYTGHPSERATVIYNGVDHGVFAPITVPESLQQVRERFGLGSEPFVLTTSSLASHKNLATITRAWRTINSRPAGRLVITGGRAAAVEALRAQLGLTESDRSVVVTGFVTDAEFLGLASSCNAFLFPSLYEGFGLPALEAMAAGAPVIASNTTSLPEVMGDAGVLLDPLDLDAWRGAITAALALPPRDHPHGPSVVRASRFSWERTAKEYVALYERAAAEKR